MSPLHVCLEGSKLVAECGARLAYLNIVKKANIMHSESGKQVLEAVKMDDGSAFLSCYTHVYDGIHLVSPA